MTTELVPDWETKCCNCGLKPVVTCVEEGEVVLANEMCGPCTWGEASTIDPENW